MKKIINRIIKKILMKFGWQNCNVCGEFLKLKWVQDCIMFPDEPPMFYHYECSECGASTKIEITNLTKKVIKDLGYKDFDDYCNKNNIKEVKISNVKYI